MAVPPKEDLLAQIDVELKRLDDSRREHGWTPWLLWASAAGLVWQFLTHVDEVRSATQTAAYWGLLVMGADAVRELMQLLIATPADAAVAKDTNPRFFSAAELTSGLRPFYLLQAARNLLAVYAVYHVHVIHGLVLKSWFAVYAAAAVMSVMTFIGTWSNLPVFAGPVVNSRSRPVIGVATWLLYTIALLLIAEGFRHAGAISLGTPEMRAAVILLGLSEVIRWLSEFSGVNPIRARLHQVRRAVALGELDLGDAFQRFEVIIYGQEQSVAIRSRAQACLEALEESASHHESFDKLAPELGSAFENAKTDAAVDDVTDAVRKLRKATDRALSRARKDADWIATRIILTRSQGRSVSPELEALQKALRERVEAAEKDQVVLAAKEKEAESQADYRKSVLRGGAI
jgi:hypothetical protein